MYGKVMKALIVNALATFLDVDALMIKRIKMLRKTEDTRSRLKSIFKEKAQKKAERQELLDEIRDSQSAVGEEMKQKAGELNSLHKTEIHPLEKGQEIINSRVVNKRNGTTTRETEESIELKKLEDKFWKEKENESELMVQAKTKNTGVKQSQMEEAKEEKKEEAQEGSAFRDAAVHQGPPEYQPEGGAEEDQ